jgi:hypothetical protein
MLAPVASRHTTVILEVGAKRVFASAVDWPGWCRSGRHEDSALAALTEYVPRYAVVADRAGVAFRPPRSYDVVARDPGNATTDFGAPGVVSDADAAALTAAQARRQVALLRASWEELDRLAVEAPETLRKGPRGGGRDRDKVVAHVIEAERSYARTVGVRHKPFDPRDQAARWALRDELAEVLAAARSGAPPGGKGWPPRYALRRIAWHVLDHVWEIEDKSDTG